MDQRGIKRERERDAKKTAKTFSYRDTMLFSANSSLFVKSFSLMLFGVVSCWSVNE